jgi:hypothetical protein
MKILSRSACFPPTSSFESSGCLGECINADVELNYRSRAAGKLVKFASVLRDKGPFQYAAAYESA